MTIRQSIRDALQKGPMSLEQLVKATGIDLVSIENSKNYLRADGIIRQVKGQKPGTKGILYELTPIPQAPKHGNVLKAPVWIPPKSLHRPTIDAPGFTVRRLLTGEML